MRNEYQLAIFDLDGTILDTLEDLADSTNYALRMNKLPPRTQDEIRSFVGNGIRKLIERAVPENTSLEVTNGVYECFKEYYEIHCKDKTRPYDGIVSVLMELRKRGVALAVLSNKADFAVQILCEEFFPGLFDVAAGAKEGIHKKPSPDGIYEILKKLLIDAKQAVYIGDSDVDIQTGKNAGMDVISVTWGFREESFLRENGAKNVLTKPEELALVI